MNWEEEPNDPRLAAFLAPCYRAAKLMNMTSELEALGEALTASPRD